MKKHEYLKLLDKRYLKTKNKYLQIQLSKIYFEVKYLLE